MAAPIRSGTLAAGEARDLVHSLAVRGLVGRLDTTGEHGWVEVRETHEDTDRLLAEVTDAVAAWLREHERPPLEIRVEGAVHEVAARSDLREELRAQVRERARRGNA